MVIIAKEDIAGAGLFVHAAGRAFKVTAIADSVVDANWHMAQPGNDDAVLMVIEEQDKVLAIMAAQADGGRKL